MLKETIYKNSFNLIQGVIIYLYNKKSYKVRYGGKYWKYRKEIEQNRNLTLDELNNFQRNRYKKFINKIVKTSDYYNKLLKNIEEVDNIDNIKNIPILNKEILRKNIEEITVKTNKKLNIGKTGGTTGKSLVVKNFPENLQERFAFLDDFRSRFGYELGKKTAWFSGKSILTQKDVNKNRFWKTDVFHKVRYYSTFHIKKEYLKYYVEDLIKFKPEYISGFPSSIYEIAKYGLQNGYEFPKDTVKAVFPTAETVTQEIRTNIETFFKSKIYDQYASSEGAPFIFECSKGKLHLELQSGVFEVLNENNEPSKFGKLVVTSFTNEGTPLLRYDIGDSVQLYDKEVICNCGNNNPVIEKILGRIDDFVYSPKNGKINLGNISNTLKDTYGIKKFQVIQEELNALTILLVVDSEEYSKKVEQKFINNWRERVGEEMKINLEFTNDIPHEKSGKFRMVVNKIKDLL